MIAREPISLFLIRQCRIYEQEALIWKEDIYCGHFKERVSDQALGTLKMM